MTKHKHEKAIKAWADGSDIQFCDPSVSKIWLDCAPLPPEWGEDKVYRIKPTEGQAMTNTAPEFLHRAATIMEERGKQYDKPGGERSMGKTVAAFNAITGQDMTEEHGWCFMMLLKQVRFFTNTSSPHRDSVEDLVAYSSLFAEAALHGTDDQDR